MIKLSFISERSIFPEQKAQILHLDKAETRLLFCQKYPFHFSFCPASHQIKSTLTNIVTHPRSTFFGKQSVCHKSIILLSQSTTSTQGEEREPFPALSTPLPVHPGRGSPNELSSPPNLTTFISPRLMVGVYLFQLCSHGSQSLGGLLQPPPARPAAHGEPSAQPSPSGSTFPPGCAEAQSTGTAFGPTEFLAGGCPCHWPSTSKAAAQETLTATYLAAQCNLITNLEALQQSIKSQPIAVV